MTPISKSMPVYPFLAVLRGSLGTGWTVTRMPDESGTGSINIVHKHIEIPLSASPLDRNTRMHELAHAFLSRGDPARKAQDYGVRFSTYQAVEDARLHYYLSCVAAIDLSEGFLAAGRTTTAAGRALQQRAFRDLSLMLVSGYQTAQELEVRRVLERAARRGDPTACLILKIAARAIEFLTRYERPTQQRTGQAARLLETAIKHLESEEAPRGPKPSSNNGKSEGGSSGNSASDRGDRSGEMDALEREAGPLLTRLVNAHTPRGSAHTAGGAEGYQARDFIEWGTLTIEEPPLVESIPRNELRRWRSAVEGWRLRSISRLLLDGKVFGQRRRRHAGAVLIDVSGSMSMSQQKVWQIVLQVPGAVVASYAGSGDAGTLRILCRNGQVAGKWACEPNFGRQNVVDLPALEWLARQCGPLVWISDGNVTGQNDRWGPINRTLAEELCKQHNITRVMSVEKAVERMRQGPTYRR